MARFFDLGRGVLLMRVGEFFAWADAMPDITRGEQLMQINALTLAGQRSVEDETFRRVVDELGMPARRAVARKPAAEVVAFQEAVERANMAWRAASAG